MAAVIAPVGIDHPHFGFPRIPLFFVFEILLQEDDVGVVHRQAHRLPDFLQLFFTSADKPFQHRRKIRNRIVHPDGFRFFQ